MARSSTDDPATRLALTGRQEEILRLIERGRTNAQIAEELGISLDGAKWHVREILARLDVESREDAVAAWKVRQRRNSRLGLTGLLFSKPALTVFSVAVGSVVIAAAVAGYAFTRGDADQEAVVPIRTVTSATNNGITLKVFHAETDDTQLTFEIGFEGRSDLGALQQPMDVRLVDDRGRHFAPSGRSRSTPNGVEHTMAPLPAGTSWLWYIVESATFASGSIKGPWAVQVIPTIRPAPPGMPVGESRQVGALVAVLDEVRQTDTETVVYAHLEYPAPVGVSAEDARRTFMESIPGMDMNWRLTDAQGVDAAMVGGRSGHGERRELIEWRFGRASGPVTIAATFSTGATHPGSTHLNEAVAQLRDLLPEPATVEWRLTLP